MLPRLKGSLVFHTMFALVFAAAIILALGYDGRARMAPLVVAVPGLLVSLGILVVNLRRQDKSEGQDKRASHGILESFTKTGSELNPFLWLLLLFGMLYVIGFAVAIPLYLFLFMRVRSREKWLFSIVFAAVSWAGLYLFFDRLLHIPLYKGLLAAFLS